MSIPPMTMTTLNNYINDGLTPGGFVMAVLANDLMRAASTADPENSKALAEIARWVRDYAPATSCGSYVAVSEWMDQKRKEKRKNLSGTK